ncbi:MAG: hypothetical protein KDH09_18675 [Chrysiogenetes bacterium]|nr:hypothetical protein [Chrysiogenetes bacterium]
MSDEKTPQKGVTTDLGFEEAIKRAVKVKPPKEGWEAVEREQKAPNLGRPAEPKKKRR